MRSVHGGGRIRRALQDSRPSAAHRVRGYHDAAPRWLPDLLADQAQQGVQANPGHHAVEQGRTVRSSPRPDRGFGALSDETVHQGRITGRDRSSRRKMTENTRMEWILIVEATPTEGFSLQ